MENTSSRRRLTPMAAIVSGFVVGTGCNAAYHLVNGLYKGNGLAGATKDIRRDALRKGGKWAVWYGIFSIFESSLADLRRKEDHWNSAIAGASTFGLFELKKGSSLRSASFSFVVAGVIGVPYFWGANKLSEKNQKMHDEAT